MEPLFFQIEGEARRAPAGAWAASAAIHSGAVVLILLLGVTDAPVAVRRTVATILAPPATAPVSRRAARVRAPRRALRAFTVPPLPRIAKQPAVELPPVAEARPKAAMPSPQAVEIQAPPPAVQTEVFDRPMQQPAASAAILLKSAPAGFDASAGVSGPKAAAAAAVSVGGFDGAGAARASASSRSTVASAAFGELASAASITESPRHARAAGFAGAEAARTPAPVQRVSAVRQFDAVAGAAPPVRAVRESREVAESLLEILFKPRPAYTDEARLLRIQGSVELEAWFGAAGQIRIVRVVRGLGHGLDENAMRAAASIRFRPATRQGRPVDTLAVVRIEFELAY